MLDATEVVHEHSTNAQNGTRVKKVWESQIYGIRVHFVQDNVRHYRGHKTHRDFGEFRQKQK